MYGYKKYRTKNIKNEISSLTSEMNNQISEIERITVLNNSLREDIEKNNAEIKKLKKEQERKKNNLLNDNSRKQAEIKSNQHQIDSLEERVNSIKIVIDSLQNNIKK